VRLLAAAILLLLVAAAAPADAQVPVRGELGGGPAFAGERVAWGEESRSGAVRIVTGPPRRLVHRLAPLAARRTARTISGYAGVFDASPTSLAAMLDTSTVTDVEFDSVSIASTLTAIGGPLDRPASVLSGCLPARGDIGCGQDCRRPGAVAVDGDRIAVAEEFGPCGEPDAFQVRIAIHQAGSVVAIPVGTEVRQVRLAGNYVAWVGWGNPHEVVVFDLVAGAPVVRLTQRDLGARHIDDLALQPDGTVAFIYGGLRDRRGNRLGWTAPGRPGVRVLDRHAGSDELALDGGRVLYERVVSERRFTGELILRALAGGERRLAHFPERRRRVGDLDLEGPGATWAAQPMGRGYEARPRGPARIVVRSL
jgi:hypothetical protein